MLVIKRLLLKLLGFLGNNGTIAMVACYIHNRKRIPNFKHPRDISEIWIKSVLDGAVKKNYFLADKYAVRTFIENKGMQDLLTPLLGVYSNADEIDFSSLPSRFALKMNFGCGMNLICKDKTKFDFENAKILLTKWMGTQLSGLEQHYNQIERKIICEAYIDDGSGFFPTDYKFMCLGGKVFCVLACSERDGEHSNYLPYSLDWQPLMHYWKNVDYSHVIQKPNNLDKMIEIAKKLAENIDLVRVDLYSNGEKIWFGEMTLTPSGCVFHRWTDKAIIDMADFYKKNKTQQ